MDNLKKEVERLKTIKKEVIVLKKVLEVATLLTESAASNLAKKQNEDGLVTARTLLRWEGTVDSDMRLGFVGASWDDSKETTRIIDNIIPVLSDYDSKTQIIHTSGTDDGVNVWMKELTLEIPIQDVLSNRILDLASNYYESRLEELLGNGKKQESVEDTIKRPYQI